MRLTLRTLLSYLDDMLEPAQAKLIGAKVVESEQARELMERIKQVTRRRRLMTPPATGPGGIDPNTIAEYLDNEVTPETAAEVEQICLASDVHLAEVAACHQILTLVLGEPALVPPTAKQRMYTLVKGPESIPFRKAPRSDAKTDDQDLSSEIDIEYEDAMRLGVPTVGSNTDRRNFWLFILGGATAACLLVGSIWMLFHNINHGGGPTKDLHAKGNDKDKTEPAKEDPGKKPPEVKKDKDDDKDKKKEPPKEDDKKTPELKQPEVVPVKIEPLPEIEYKPASLKHVPIGVYLPPNMIKEPGVLFQYKLDKTGWMRVPLVKEKRAITSGLALLSLSGTKSVLKLDTDIELTLWGNLPELTLDPLILESQVTIHEHAQLDLDLTLHRGRVIIKSHKAKDALVRVRFINPLASEEKHFDIALHGPESAVIVERFCELDRDEPFYEKVDDPLKKGEKMEDPLRKGPTAWMRVYGYAKSASVKFGQIGLSVDEANQPVLEWQNRVGKLDVPSPFFPPPWLKGTPPLKLEAELLARKKATAAHDKLARLLDQKALDVAFAELDEEVKQGMQKDLLTEKRLSADTLALWWQLIRCASATDNLDYLFDEFASEKTPAPIRWLYLQALHQWLALHRDHDYMLLKVAQKHYRKAEPSNIMYLFHKVSLEDARKPATFSHLIEGLNNDLLPIRALSQWHLYGLAPAGQNIPYDPAMPPAQRQAAVRAWTQLVPPGQMPPAPVPPKKDKGN